jgi:hypothetical protein
MTVPQAARARFTMLKIPAATLLVASVVGLLPEAARSQSFQTCTLLSQHNRLSAVAPVQQWMIRRGANGTVLAMLTVRGGRAGTFEFREVRSGVSVGLAAQTFPEAVLASFHAVSVEAEGTVRIEHYVNADAAARPADEVHPNVAVLRCP